MIFPPLMLASVARPVEDKVETVEAKAFSVPVDDRDEPVIFPAFRLAIVASPVPERVVTVVVARFVCPVTERLVVVKLVYEPLVAIIVST